MRTGLRVLMTGSAGFVALIVAGVAPLASPVQADGMKFSGDFRLRYENTQNQLPGSPVQEARSREVVRVRAAVEKAVNDYVTFGARLATGSSGDPNTTDVTLGSFVDDLEVSLDQAFLSLKREGVALVGGKFPNPFRRSDLVWDGDVNPQGVALALSHGGQEGVSAKLAGMLGIVDEQSDSTVPDSQMFGVQGELSVTPGESDVRVTVAGGYFDYDIKSLTNADAGDTRSNMLNGAGTAYVSDFNLFDAIAKVQLNRSSQRFPVELQGEYVKNLGAEIAGDQGFSADVAVGRSSKRSDARFSYGYSEAETDAVLAAFSNDNTTIATNYQQHTVTVDYVPLDDTTLTLILYVYGFKDLSGGLSDELATRLRLNAVVKF